MDDITRKKIIMQAMAEMECYPVMQDEIDLKDYNQIPMGQIASMGAMFSSLGPTLQNLINAVGSSNNGEVLYRMIDPLNGAGRVTSVGNIYKAGTQGIAARARFVEATPTAVGTVAQISPAIMLMAIAISVVTKKLDQIEDAQKDIIEFLQLKEKAQLKGNIATLKEILEEYKFNWDNDKFKNNKHIQVQEIKRDSEQSIIFCREQIEKKVTKNGFLHSDRDVRTKIQKIQYVFKDYELAMYIFAFSSFMEIMLLENFDSGYLGSVIKKIELYADNYRNLYQDCCDVIEKDSKTSVQSYVLKGVAGLNKVLGIGISKIPKVSEGNVDEALISAGERVDEYSEKRTENTMKLFLREECTCIIPFVENISAIDMIYNAPMDLLFDGENIYFKLSAVA